MTHPDLTVIDHPLVQHKLSLMRDTRTPSPEFRRLLREIALLLTYEATRDLTVAPQRIDTPLTAMDAPMLAGPDPAVVSILRAGNGLLDGVLDVVPTAKVGFVGLYRDEETLRPIEYYNKLPSDMPGRFTIAVDPMLATGHSAAAAIDLLKQAGSAQICFICLLAAPEGVAVLGAQHPDVRIVTASLDSHLNEKGYIVPGLGDAGDRIFGTV